MIGTTVSHYKILEKLGQGGMGEVWKAEDTQLRRTVALKFLSSETVGDEEIKARLIREAQASASLDHPNICQVFGIHDEKGETFIAMAHIDGPSLADKIKERPLPVDDALDIAIQIAQGLQEAHEKGIVHRDIKPQNIMLTAKGQVKIMDFGLAQLGGRSKLTKAGTTLGTPAYMSPEQLQGLEVDQRADVWALGCVLYEMLTQRTPFQADYEQAIAYGILNEEPEPVTAQRSGLPLELDRIVEKALSKDLEGRYQHADETLADLRAVRKQHRTPRADTPSAAAKKSIGRRAIPKIAWVVASLFAVILAGWWMYDEGPRSTVLDSELQSLAILPFRLVSQGEPDDYLTLGIADTLIMKVSQIRGLAVRPTSAIRQYAGQDTDALTAARELQVEAVLEGTVQRVGDRVRIGINLVRVEDGLSVWAATIVLPLSDIFAVQDKVAEQVATQLRFQLDDREQQGLAKQTTANPEAHEYYLRAMRLFDRRDQIIQTGSRQDFEEMIALLKRAVEVDPNYALAEAQLAHAYIFMGLFVETANDIWIQRAEEAIARAEALNRNEAEIHVARHQLLFSVHGGYQVAEAVRELLRAQEINPSVGRSELASLYAHLGLEEQAFQQIERALEIDPLSARNQSRFVSSNELLGLYDEAIAAESRFYNRPGPVRALLAKSRLDEAQPMIQRGLDLTPNSPQHHGSWALLMALRGKFREAEAEGERIVELEHDRSYHHATFSMAAVYALQGKTEEAVSWLRRTASAGMPNYLLFSRDPHLDRIRNDPEFIALMSDVKEQWEELQEQIR